MGKNKQLIESIRNFNRVYTSKLGILNPQALDTEYSLLEGRIIYEIGSGRPIARDLTKLLGVDEGYLSRILNKFERSGLIIRSNDESDKRKRYLGLTNKGQELYKVLNARADKQIEDLLKPLSSTHQKELEKAIQILQDLVSKAEL